MKKTLAAYLGVGENEVSEVGCDHYGLTVFEVNGEEYAIGRERECEQAWDEYINDHIDNCVLSELPEQYRIYFDTEAFRQDCRVNGRGNYLSAYDGMEIALDGYLAYRIN